MAPSKARETRDRGDIPPPENNHQGDMSQGHTPTSTGDRVTNQVPATPGNSNVTANSGRGLNPLSTPLPLHNEENAGPLPVPGNDDNSEVNTFARDLSLFLAQVRHQPQGQRRGSEGDFGCAARDHQRSWGGLIFNHPPLSPINKNFWQQQDCRPHNRSIRDNQATEVRVLQQNCNKSPTTNREIRDLIRRRKNRRYVFFCTEPGLARRYGAGPRVPTGFDFTKNVFFTHKGNDDDIRSCILADDSQEIDLFPQYSNRDVTTAIWRTRLAKSSGPANTRCKAKGKPNKCLALDKTSSTVNMDVDPSLTASTAGSIAGATSPTDSRNPNPFIPHRSTSTTSTAALQVDAPGRKTNPNRRDNLLASSPTSEFSQSPKRGDETTGGTGAKSPNLPNNPERSRRDLSTNRTSRHRWSGGPSDCIDGDDAGISPERVTSWEDAEIILCSIYWDAQLKEDLPNGLVSSLEFAADNGIPVIVCGDLNAHSVLWGSPTSDRRGEIIEDLCMAFDLVVLNVGGHHTYEKGDKQTHIDVSLCSASVAKRFKNWHVSDSETFSDHKRIEMDFVTGTPSLQLGRKLRGADWDLFSLTVSDFSDNHPIPEQWNLNRIEAQVSVFESAIQVGLDKVAPYRPRLKNFKEPYNEPEVLKCKQRCKRLVKKWRRDRADKIKYKAYRAACYRKKAAFRQADKQRWQQFTSEVADPKGAAKLVRAMKNDCFVPPTLIRDDDTFTHSKRETVELLLDVHFPGSVQHSEPELDHYFNEILDDAQGLQQVEPLRWIDEDKVRRAISSFSDFKACGPDDIKPVILKHLPRHEIKRLVAIFTASVRLGYVPRRWTQSRTVFIPKPGRDDYSIPKSFRPISLTSFCFKTMERLVLWHLERTIFRRKPLHEKQHAFRKGHSTELAISEVVNTIEGAIYNNKVALATFLDIEGAFDNLQTTAAIKAMKAHQLDDVVIRWYSYYLHHRTSTVHYGNSRSERALTRGTPQGGVLSPILWNLSFDSLLAKFDKGNVQIFGYADDACLLSTGYSSIAAVKRMQSAVDKCVNWGDKHGLKFSAKKTVVMFFHRKSNYEPPARHITMLGKDIPYAEECRYLGLTLDPKLKWHLHFSKKMKVAKGLLFKMKNSLGITWGLKPHLLRWIYTGIVRPAITYGALAWGHSIRYKHQLARLKSMHGLVTRMLAPKRKSTPIAGLEMIGYIPPLDIFLRGEAVKAYVRNKHALPNTWSGINKKGTTVGHLALARETAEHIEVPDIEWDRQPERLHFDETFTIEEDSFLFGKDISPANSLVCYTDGSKQTKEDIVGVGCGFVVFGTNKEGEATRITDGSFNLDPRNSVYQAEVQAITQAANSIYRLHDDKIRKITYIMSDSRSALQTLQRHWIGSKSVEQCLAALGNLATKTEVRLRWIKAHANHRGNEEADTLAKAGACAYFPEVNLQGIQVENLHDIPPPYSYLINRVAKGVETLWSRRWMGAKKPDGSPMYRQSKFFFKTPDKLKAYNLMRLGRDTLSKCIQFITGHAFLRRHQGLVDMSTNPDNAVDQTCRLCSTGEETPFHLIMECRELTHHRQRLFRQQPDDPQDPNCTIRWSARAIAQFISSEDIKSLIDVQNPNNSSQVSHVDDPQNPPE